MATNPVSREAAKKNNSLRDFQGVNTQAARQVIGDNQFAWLENVQPVGFGNMPAVPAPSAPLATWAGTAYHIQSVNIGGIDYELVLTTNGSLFAVNLITFAVTAVAPSNTFSAAGASIAQFENTQAIIVDPTTGYFSWDGSTLTRWNGQIQQLAITTLGNGYTTAPMLAFSGGGGTGAAGTIGIQVGLLSVTAAGTGYATGDLLTISGGTFTTAAVVKVASVNGTGVITGINLVNAGSYTVAPSNPASCTGGYGSGATFTLNFGIGPILTTTPGTGYTSAPTVTLSGGGGTGGAVTPSLYVVPSYGTAVATYAGRVWVASGRTVIFSAPESFNDFTSTSSGGSFIVIDETLHSTIQALVSANNFLYILGSSSVNVVADVSVVNGATVFSNTNISASIGTTQAYAVIPYYRALWFVAPYGIYALYGSTTQKASDDLDGVFPFITSDIPFTSGTAVIHNINVLCFMFRYNDPLSGVSRALIACFSNKKWFFCSQGDTLRHIDTAVINGSPTLFATDGSSLYKLFSDSTGFVPQTIRTKLWDMGDPLADKQVLKLGLEVVYPAYQQNITGTLDTEIYQGGVPFSFTGDSYASWANNSGIIAQWENSAGTIVPWSASGYLFFAQDIQTTGRYVGVTINGNSVGPIYSGVHLQYEMRVQWPQGGAM